MTVEEIKPEICGRSFIFKSFFVFVGHSFSPGVFRRDLHRLRIPQPEGVGGVSLTLIRIIQMKFILLCE
jgi:hypothetical protein